MTLPEAYRLSFLVTAAYSMGAVQDPRGVALPPSFEAVEYVIANDFGLGRSNFGVIALDHTTGKLVRALRGSQTIEDWGEDARFVLVGAPTKAAGRMEAGFVGVIGSVQTLSGRPMPKVDQSIAHSLGCPVESYFSALDGADACALESPEPGDATYSLWVSGRCAGYLNIQNPHDLVPDAPGRLLGYRDIGTITHLPFGNPFPITFEEIAANHALANVQAALAVIIA